MFHINADWIALLVMALSTWFYARWLWVTEPDRLQRDAKVKAMEQSVCHLELATPESLRSLLVHGIKGYRRAKIQFWVMLVFVLLLFLVAYRSVSPASAGEEAGAFLMVAWVVAPFLCMRFDRLRRTRKRVYEVVTQLNERPVQNSLGVLIEAMECGDIATANRARQSVIAILPNLQATDAGLLLNRHRTYLHRALRGTNSEFILAILQALEQVGDTEAIPYVKRLVPCPVWLAYSHQIEAASIQCLATLHKRKREREAAYNLLRATTTADAPADVLLRPVRAGDATNPRHLLRASMSADRTALTPQSSLPTLRARGNSED